MAPKIVELYNFIRSIRNENFFSNLFYLPTQLNVLYEQGKCTILIGKNLALILVKDVTLQRLYFCARSKNLDELPTLLKGQCIEVMCCDVVTEDTADTVDGIFNEVGMYRYSTFVRLVRNNNISHGCVLDLSEVSFAVEEDFNQIKLLLWNTFDQWTAHFPTDGDITNAIKNKEIFVVRKDGRLIALAYYDSEGLYRTCLKYYIVVEGYRGTNISEKILYAKLVNHNKSKSYYLWVDEKNKFGLERHHKNCFFEDGLKDHIYRFCEE